MNKDELDIYGELLDFQQTEEGQAVVEAGNAKYLAWKRKKTILYQKRHPEWHNARAVARKHRDALYAAQGGLCKWCKQPLGDDCVIDHIIPLCKGGSNEVDNLCVCHAHCNNKKSDKIVKGR